MKKIFAFMMALLLVASFAFAIDRESQAFWGDESQSPQTVIPYYGIRNFTFDNVYGEIKVLKITVRDSNFAKTFRVYNEAGTAFLNFTSEGGSDYNNRSGLNYTNYGTLTVEAIDNFTSNALFPQTRLAWYRLDDNTGTAATDQESGPNMTLSSSDLWITDVLINTGVAMDGNDYLSVAPTNINISNQNVSIIIPAKINGNQTNTYLCHQGTLGTDATIGQIECKTGFSTATNSSYIEYKLYSLKDLSVAANTSAITNTATNSSTLYTSSLIKNSAYTGRVNVTYDYPANALVTVSLNGVSLGTLNATSPNYFNVSQANMVEGANTITFVSNDTLVNITNSSIDYYTYNTTAINLTLATNTTFANNENWYSLAIFRNTTNTTYYTFLNETESTNKNYSTAIDFINSTDNWYFGDGTSFSNYLSGTYDEIMFANENISSSSLDYLDNRTGRFNPTIQAIWKRN